MVGCYKLVPQTAGGQAMLRAGTAECGQVLWSGSGWAAGHCWVPDAHAAQGSSGEESGKNMQPPAVFPIDFSCTKLAGNVALGHHVTVGCCNCYNCKPIDQHLNYGGDIMTVAILRTGHRSRSFSNCHRNFEWLLNNGVIQGLPVLTYWSLSYFPQRLAIARLESSIYSSF